MELDNLGLLPPDGTCAYCGTRSTSDEHVFPVWVSSALGSTGGFVIHGRRKPRQTNKIPVTTDRVCETCNNGWLSVLENDSKPVIESMLLGRDRHLSETDQERLGAWAYKTTLMLDMVGEGAIPLGYFRILSQHYTRAYKTTLMLDMVGEGAIPLGYFRTFANNRMPPSSAIIWIGAYIGDKAAVVYHKPLQTGSPPDVVPLGLLTTFSIGRLLVQVIQHFTKGGAHMEGDRTATVALDRIWPMQPAFSWPRQRVGFGDDSLRELAASINLGGEQS